MSCLATMPVPHVNVHVNRNNIVHWAQDNPRVAADAHHQYQFYEWLKLEIILADDVIFNDDACPHANVHVNRHIVHWAQDNPHVAADAPHQNNPSINVWCTIHGNTCLGLLLLGGVEGG